MVEAGKHYFESKDYTHAEHYFKKVLAKAPRYADVLNLMGVIRHVEGKFDSAMSFFKKSLEVNPNYTEAILNLAVLCNDLGKYNEAKKLYTHLRSIHKVKHKHIEPVLKGRLSNMHADIADVYKNLSLYEYAIEEYRKALLLNPQYADIRTRLGVALRENQQLKDSLGELQAAVKTDPKYLHAKIQLGVTLFSMGKTNEAKKFWAEVLKKDAANEFAKMYLKLAEKDAAEVKPAAKKSPVSKRR